MPYYWYYGLLGVLSQFQKNPFFSQSQSNLCFYVKTTAFSSLLFHFSIHSFIHSPIIEHVPCSGDRKNNIWAETWKIIWVLSVLGPYPHGAYILVWEMDSKQVKYISKKDNYNLWLSVMIRDSFLQYCLSWDLKDEHEQAIHSLQRGIHVQSPWAGNAVRVWETERWSAWLKSGESGMRWGWKGRQKPHHTGPHRLREEVWNILYEQ